MLTSSITQDEYRLLRAHGYAGTRAELLLEATRAAWPATHWMLQNTPEGTALVPIAVVHGPPTTEDKIVHTS